MSAYETDPTPCPLPRVGITTLSQRASSLADNDPSVTLPVQGILRDGKPRRPRQKKQSIGWDPTIDIYDDTFVLQKPSQARPPPQPQPQPTAAPQRHAEPESILRTAENKPNRRSTFLGQPAQRVPFDASSDGNSDKSNANRRGSMAPVCKRPKVEELISEEPENEQRVASKMNNMKKEPRRRTIYVPSEDTTIMTIHPGNKARFQKDNPRKPRRSDIFFDLATLGDEDLQPQQKASSLHVPDRRAPRKSLAIAPRRVPLQQNIRPSQPQTTTTDVPGKGGGKENVPPGGLGEVKRLGKRASLVIPEKPKAPPIQGNRPTRESLALDTIQESGSPQTKEHPGSVLNRSQGVPMPSEPHVPEKENSKSKSSNPMRTSSMRRDSLPGSKSAIGGAKRLRHSMIPSSLSAPKISTAGSSNLQKYPVITEDISDPSMYEDHWLSHQEQAMTQLINNLFSRANFQPDSASTTRQAMRQDLLEIYLRPDMPLLHKRLQASVRFGALSLPSETLAQVARFKDDCGQRQRFLDLWTKTYNPDSLEVAAEVVVGHQINGPHRTSGSPPTSRRKNINSFLKAFLVYNQDSAPARHSTIKASADEPIGFFGQDYANGNANNGVAWGWRRTVLRSLMLIHLLDHAQSSRKFHSCLFTPNSPYKTSSAVLQGLCRILLPTIGDVSRVLGHLGYHLAHVQYPLEEYDYSIGSLAIDLRDGVRLTRLVETLLYPPGSLDIYKDNTTADFTVTMPTGDILTSKTLTNNTDSNTNTTGNSTAEWPLSQHLKYPCPSRAQKLYNVQIALSALDGVQEAKPLLEGLKADDIVDGHREKSVRLLWGLVGRWGLGHLVDFELVGKEIRRLRQEKRVKAVRFDAEGVQTSNGVRGVDVEEEEEEHDIARTKPPGVKKNTTPLLKCWAIAACNLHGVEIHNLSTSFADGEAYRAIIQEYVPYLGLPSTASTTTTSNHPPRPSSQHQHQHQQTPHIRTLKAFGCSQAFTQLFAPSNTPPTSFTTLPLLSFLASRLLPAAERGIAAVKIQRVWRVRKTVFEMRRRVVCARLARDAARVVEGRERLVWAVRVLEGWWKDVCWK
ncbi:MAG: hypothetical protein M1831_006399 [Alyxoria varia]|nr:MAG: hypothetical protein M1831_006399 [Alyxoria varia]